MYNIGQMEEILEWSPQPQRYRKSTQKENYLRLHSEVRLHFEASDVLHGNPDRTVTNFPWTVGESFKGYMMLVLHLKG